MTFAASSILLLLGAFSVAIASFATRFFRPPQVFISALIVCFCGLTVLMFVSAGDIYIVSLTISTCWALLLGLSWLLRTKLPAMSRQIVLIILCSTPFVSFFLGAIAFEIVGKFSYIGNFVSTTDLRAVLLGVFAVGPILIFWLFARPIYPILAEVLLSPKSE